MNRKRVLLQGFYIALMLFNIIYSVSFIWIIRRCLLMLTGAKIGKGSTIQRCRFFGFGHLKVGENTIINSGCYLDNRRGINIGSNVIIAHDTKIYTLGHDIDDSNFATKGSPVIIEDFAVVFSNVMIMPGVTIKKGAVVLPGSVISKDVESMAVVGGNPVKLIKMRKSLHTDKEGFRYWFSI